MKKATKEKGEHVRGISVSLSMAQMFLNQRADRAQHESAYLVKERRKEEKKEKGLLLCADMSLLHAQSDTRS